MFFGRPASGESSLSLRYFFMFNLIGRQDPPPITHPGFYYGFATAALAWQIAFLVIASDPVRLRPLTIPSVVEKFAYGAAVVALFLESRMRLGDLLLGSVDILLGILFVAAFFKTRVDAVAREAREREQEKFRRVEWQDADAAESRQPHALDRAALTPSFPAVL